MVTTLMSTNSWNGSRAAPWRLGLTKFSCPENPKPASAPAAQKTEFLSLTKLGGRSPKLLLATESRRLTSETVLLQAVSGPPHLTAATQVPAGKLPPWQLADLPAPPGRSLGNVFRTIGPGAILLGTAIGGGECLHVLYVNRVLLPPAVRPPLWRQITLVLCAAFYGTFVFLSVQQMVR